MNIIIRITLLSLLLISCDDINKDDVKVISCNILQKDFVAKANSSPLYTKLQGSCKPIKSPNLEIVSNYYADSSCLKEIEFIQTNFNQECVNMIDDPQGYGYADWNKEDKDTLDTLNSSKWMLSQISRVEAMSVRQNDHEQPYFKRVEYTSPKEPDIEGKTKQCKLEMLVFKENINAENLKSAIFIHGGSWKYRDGITAHQIAPNLTSKGYVVFAPYYRLAGKAGRSSCNNYEAKDTLKDLDTALDWVKNQGNHYGATNTKIVLIGQSAGAHLAGYLAMKNPSDIKEAILLYPPADLEFFVEKTYNPVPTANLYANSKYEPLATSFISTFFNVNKKDKEAMYALKDNLDLQNSSIPEKINGSPGNFPIMHVIGGIADQLIPPLIYLRTYEALSGKPLSDQKYTGDGEDSGYSADKSSFLLLKGAKHMLDLRCFDEENSLIKILMSVIHIFGPTKLSDVTCAPGSEKNSMKIKQRLENIYNDL